MCACRFADVAKDNKKEQSFIHIYIYKYWTLDFKEMRTCKDKLLRQSMFVSTLDYEALNMSEHQQALGIFLFSINKLISRIHIKNGYFYIISIILRNYKKN